MQYKLWTKQPTLPAHLITARKQRRWVGLGKVVAASTMPIVVNARPVTRKMLLFKHMQANLEQNEGKAKL